MPDPDEEARVAEIHKQIERDVDLVRRRHELEDKLHARYTKMDRESEEPIPESDRHVKKYVPAPSALRAAGRGVVAYAKRKLQEVGDEPEPTRNAPRKPTRRPQTRSPPARKTRTFSMGGFTGSGVGWGGGQNILNNEFKFMRMPKPKKKNYLNRMFDFMNTKKGGW